MTCAIVSDGEARAALATVRSLGRAGLEVWVLATRPGTLAGRSRYAAREILVPSALSDPRGWRDTAYAQLDARADAWLLPITELACGTALEGELHPRALLPPAAAYAWLTDKWSLGQRAGELGLHIPRTHLAKGPDALADQGPPLPFPLVLKSRRSLWREAEGWRRGCVLRLHDAGALAAASASGALAELGEEALVQEALPGHGEGLFFLCREGEPLLRFAHRRLREKPPRGGVSVLSESIPVCPELAAPCEQILREQRWTGAAMFEFRRTPEGTAYLLEVNPRFWGSLQLAVDAGFDVPLWFWRMYQGQCVPREFDARPARLRWLLGDLDHLWLMLRNAEQRRALGRSRRQALLEFARSFRDGSRLEVLRRSDLAPFLAELRAWLR